MDIQTALLEIDGLVSSENYKNENLKLYLIRKFKVEGTISHKEFELIEKIIILFINSLTEMDIRLLWEQTESGQTSIKSDDHEFEIISQKSDLESELLDLYFESL